MIIERTYKFNPDDYNADGFNKYNNVLFSEYIQECEDDFYKEAIVFHANCFLANDATMLLLKRCNITEPNEDYGMNLIDGEIDLDTNLEIEEHSERITVYAINTSWDMDEPLYLIIDEDLRDGEFILKYIPEDDNEDDNKTETPVDKKIKDKIFQR